MFPNSLGYRTRLAVLNKHSAVIDCFEATQSKLLEIRGGRLCSSNECRPADADGEIRIEPFHLEAWLDELESLFDLILYDHGTDIVDSTIEEDDQAWCIDRIIDSACCLLTGASASSSRNCGGLGPKGAFDLWRLHDQICCSRVLMCRDRAAETMGLFRLAACKRGLSLTRLIV